MRVTRRRFLVSVGAVGTAAVGTDALFIEPNRVTVSFHELGQPSGPSAPKLRIVQLTDLHLQRVDGHVERIADETNRLKPDLIVIIGDSVDRPDRLSVLSDFLGLLDRDAPKYATLGNWEYHSHVFLPDLEQVYADHNCRLLVNEAVVHRAHGSSLLVTGLDDLMGGRPNLTHALKGVERTDHHLLLMHCPGYRDYLITPRAKEDDHANYADHPIDYMLSGHTHGGQITFFGAAPITPDGSGRYVKGWYREGGLPLYISRGLGTTTVRARFCCPPEIAVFDWTLGKSQSAAM